MKDKNLMKYSNVVNASKKVLVAGSLTLVSSLLVFGAATDRLANPSGSPFQKTTVVVSRFEPESGSNADPLALSSQACAEYSSANSSASAAPNGDAPPSSFTVEPKMQDAISNELQTKLSKKTSVMVDPDPNSIPVGSVIVSGCIFQADKGRATRRMVGQDVGESRLGAHIVFLSKVKTGVTPLDSFDLQVKGTWAEHPGESLRADGKKLADQTAKKPNSYLKQRE